MALRGTGGVGCGPQTGVVASGREGDVANVVVVRRWRRSWLKRVGWRRKLPKALFCIAPVRNSEDALAA